jgi:hypothetical protein
MSERKTIQINPDLFKMSKKNTSRKKDTPSNKIQLKPELKSHKQKTLRKNVLKMIREKQQDAYRELFDKKKPPVSTGSSEFDKDFDSSLKFFSSLANKVESETIPAHNTTFKNYNAISTSPSLINNLPTIETLVPSKDPPISLSPIPSLSFPSSLPSSLPLSTPIYISHMNRLPNPTYGCLKNGTLPTYRTYTRKNWGGGAPPQTQINPTFMTQQKTLPISEPVISSDPFDRPLLTNRPTPKFIEQFQKFDKIQQGTTKEKAKQRIKYRKRKKIYKRTYKVGRSKVEHKVGVLISNKTIRSRITTEAQLLKQTPIQEVRKFLIKKGFIKIGTNAPNDVLRKMYETVRLVCGEIQNHNPENLLYNFIHDKE